MPAPTKLTPAEWEIMEAVWRIGGSPSVREVLEHAFPAGEKAYTTVQTVMNTLEKKKLLRRRKKGLVNFYTPLKRRREMVQAETRSLLARVFGGSVPALASSLLSVEELDLDELEQIKTLLARREEELKEGNS